ncbi:MAG: PDDEXK nuclease domain-containing protein [Desulfurellaceae bacterium]|nr:PDDEXK nuclease domain-containing protein [Desulfurellaceae bacterium]
MSQGFDFEHLVELCRQTHEETRQSATRAVDHSLVVRNWLFGWYIVEFENGGADRSELYGKELIARLSNKLKAVGLKGCSPTNLRKFREFYQGYPEIQQTLSVNSVLAHTGIAASVFSAIGKRFPLGWSHYVTLLTIDNPDARRFYEIEASESDWSVRELERQIASSLYERLALSRDKEEVRRLAHEGQVVEKASDLIKNPLVLEFLGLEEKPAYSETELETAIIDRLQHFLLELGKGFLFETRQKRFTFDNRHFFVDLVFYNRLLRCYVLIDLKRGELTHQDLGQMQMYVNYFDRYVKTKDELPTVGILLCDSKSDAVVELTLPRDANIYASQYKLYLPSKQELAAQLESVHRELENRKGNGK